MNIGLPKIFIAVILLVTLQALSASADERSDFYNSQDFRGDAKEHFKVWPYIPFFRGADLDNFQEAHSRTRKETVSEYIGHLVKLIKASGDIDKSLKALLVIDQLYEKHRESSLRGLPLTLEEQFKSSLDSLYRIQRIPYRKLSFVNSTNARDIIKNLTTYVKSGQVPMGEWDYGKYNWDFDKTFKKLSQYRSSPDIHIPYDSKNPPVDMFMYGTYTVMPVKRKLQVEVLGEEVDTWDSNGRRTRGRVTSRRPILSKDENVHPVQIKVTITMVKLSTGESQSFNFSATPAMVMAPLAAHIFKYFQGRRHVPYDVVKNYMWLPQAPGHVDFNGNDKKVNYFVAERTCKRQAGATLPTLEELEDGIADGEFFEGLNLNDDGWAEYFINEGDMNRGKASWDQQTPFFNPGARSGDPVSYQTRSNRITANYRCIKHFRKY